VFGASASDGATSAEAGATAKSEGLPDATVRPGPQNEEEDADTASNDSEQGGADNISPTRPTAGVEAEVGEPAVMPPEFAPQQHMPPGPGHGAGQQPYGMYPGGMAYYAPQYGYAPNGYESPPLLPCFPKARVTFHTHHVHIYVRVSCADLPTHSVPFVWPTQILPWAWRRPAVPPIYARRAAPSPPWTAAPPEPSPGSVSASTTAAVL
jgi:hypothetical protein